jgi:hypothetical protein
MIERIEQLAEQCVTRKFYVDHASEEFDYKKFAELIVKECVTMCDDTRADYFKHRKSADDFQDKNIYAEGEAASDIIKYKIKKHFGVEE